MIGLMGSLVSSCQQSLDEEVQLPATISKARFTFTIALDDAASRASRADEWEENETDPYATVGTEYENVIDLETGFEIRAHYTNSYGLTDVAEVTVTKFEKLESVNQYRVEAEMKAIANTETLACRLEVYANCTSDNLTFNQGVEFIPMWGVKQTTLYLDKDQATELADPIYLLRSVAKVEVMLDGGLVKDFSLTSVTIDKYNKTGYVLPYGSASASNTESMNQSAVFNPYSTTNTLGANLGFNSVKENNFYVYLPEFQNVDSDGSELPTAAKMIVTINGRNYPLEFKTYADNTPFDVVRNHCYQYVIKSVKEDVDFELNYQVEVWKDITDLTVTFK